MAEPVFDLEAAYNEHVLPLVDRLADACEAHGLPLITSVCYAHDGKRLIGCGSTSIPRGGWRPEAFRAFDRWVRNPDARLVVVEPPPLFEVKEVDHA